MQVVGARVVMNGKDVEREIVNSNSVQVSGVYTYLGATVAFKTRHAPVNSIKHFIFNTLIT